MNTSTLNSEARSLTSAQNEIKSDDPVFFQRSILEERRPDPRQ
jgi:hypothetical protein